VAEVARRAGVYPTTIYRRWGTNPVALVELVIGPALVRTLFLGSDLGPAHAQKIVARAWPRSTTTLDKPSVEGRSEAGHRPSRTETPPFGHM